MARSFTYKGFKNDKGQVLIGVTVEAYDASSGALLESTVTDSSGDAAFTALPDAEEADLKFIWGDKVHWVRLGEGIEKVGASPKVGFFDATKVVQQNHIADAKTDYAAGDLDTEAEIITAINASNTTINAILARLETFGLSKTT